MASAGPAEGIKLIEEMIEAEGPFDGLLGFSQGAGICLSYLLDQRIRFSDKPPSFKFAVLFSTGCAISPDAKYKQDELMAMFANMTQDDIKELHGVIFRPNARKQDLENCSFMGKLSASEKHNLLEIGWGGYMSFQARAVHNITDEVQYWERLLAHELHIEEFPRFYNPVWTSEKLTIPTVHSIGRGDSDVIKGLLELGRAMCENGVLVEHAGKHDLPYKKEDVVPLANAIEKAYYLGQQIAVAV
jgi:hypothetical protein